MPLPDDPQRLRGVKNLYLLTDLGLVDLLGELPGIGSFDDLRERTVKMDVGGFHCRVLDLDTLIAAKRAAGRGKDMVGVRHLEVIKQMSERQSPST